MVACEYLLPADKTSRTRWSIKANVCRFPRHVTGFVVRQQERNWSVAHDEDAPRSAFPGPSRETIRPVTCLKQQARKMGCRAVYGVYE
jgi:hypothetical protein